MKNLSHHLPLPNLTPGISCFVGLSNLHKALFIYALEEQFGRGGVVITDSEPSAVKMCEEINNFFGEERALHYPSKDFALRNFEGQSLEYEHKRLSVLSRLLDNRASLVVASAEAAAQMTIPPEILIDRTFTLSVGDEISSSRLAEKLLASGYTRVAQVEGATQFAQRGGITDFFPPDLPFPIRLELWGDEIDTISTFRIESQRREESLNSVCVFPSREVLVDENSLIQILTELLASKSRKTTADFKTYISNLLSQVQAGVLPATLDPFIHKIYPQNSDLYSYIEDKNIYICDISGAKESLRAAAHMLSEDIVSLIEEGKLASGYPIPLSDYTRLIMTAESHRTLLLESFGRSFNDIKLVSLQNISALMLSAWGGELDTLKEDLDVYIRRGYVSVVLTTNEVGAGLLVSDLTTAGLPCEYKEDLTELKKGRVYIATSDISAGFELPEIGLAVIVTGQRGKAKKKTKIGGYKKGAQIRDIADLEIGDYVVNVHHGIGVYEGIVKQEIQGVVKDYIKIRYRGTDKLFIPVTQLDLITKYIGGGEDSRVKLNKLGSADWSKTRARVKASVSNLAKELIEIYSKRLAQKGHAFSEDTEWQREFEERFLFTETDDQLRSIAEIKHDMERTSPMERLLCGDVGFGKTEVALRAAFKCVMDGKQCAVLVPTTILAWQHFQTFRSRFEGYPVNIELLSRFRTPAQQKDIIKDMRRGVVDIVIGTHRLVQKDIEFKDLGLVIIDEEQRFGVAHKEKLKQLRGEVDVLALSATPIPRTLNMAMSGIRDMSTIDEAPQDRHPVQTYVIEHDDKIIADAIARELRRGGQVFYLHNRISSIDGCAARLQEYLPDANIVVAHGRMTEAQLSEIWRSLIEGETDILVCTTIIEAGVDVPNCNTIIIEDADYYGLSQLYQIRGRVGRSTRRAFAYLTFRRGKIITELAEKRLSAIKEFTAFGSGFRIAMRDLEIRGAGDILGSAQHGFMESVGYDLYLQMLGEAVAKEKGKPQSRSLECTVDLQISAHIPEGYISDMSQRIDIYKKIASIRTDADQLDITDELIDRFGDPPKAVVGLIEIALLRGKAASLGINEIKQTKDALLVYPLAINMQLVGQLANHLRGRVMLSNEVKPYIAVKFKKHQKVEEAIREVIEVLAQAAETSGNETAGGEGLIN